MRCPRLAQWLFDLLIVRVAARRDPDFVVGADGPGGAYLRRWYLTPWRHWQGRLRALAQHRPTAPRRLGAWAAGLLPNLYLHQFLRDDDDRALHDHPSWSASLMLEGRYIEHTIAAGGIHQRRIHRDGSLRFMGMRHAHRIALHRQHRWIAGRGLVHEPIPCWTLFLMGPTVRNWGFHCPQRGFVPWQRFTAGGRPGEIGRGCD